MNEFVNPYHFCPVVAGQRQGDMDVADFDKRKAKFVSHARYAPDTFSGRVVCRLTTEDAVFIGKEIVREPSESEPGQVAPFELDRRPAIPASSLRGLISSIAEAASNSSLRILQNTMYSYRQELATQSLSAIGMVVKENGEFRLRPLTLPTIKVDGHRQDASLQAPELEGYRPMFPIPNLKVYFGNESSIRAHDFPYQTLDVGAPKFYYMQVEMAQWADAPTRRKAWSPKEHRKNIKNRFEFLLGQDSPDAWPLPEKTWSALPPKRKRLYTRGIVRVLGCGPGREDIPETKKHEVFIPCPENFVYLPTFPIPQAVVDRFEMLADDRTEARKDGEPLPYSPVGTTRGDSSNPRKLRLKHGDLVYFRPTRNGEAVSEISFSSVWRGRVERRDSQSIPERPETTYDFFRAVDPELLPFNPRRQKITIAEQLFGFVEELESNADRPARALAGKIRFSHGLLHQFRKADYSNWSRESGMETPYDAPVTLKILDSPKPPCPALYFKTASRPHHAVSARELAPGACQPQGRKFYIHRRGAQDEPKQPWKHTPREGEKQTTHGGNSAQIG